MCRKTHILFLWAALYGNAVHGRRFVVIDMESKVPVRNVVVQYGENKSTVTIWDGSFMLDSLDTDSTDVQLTLSRSGYMTRSMTYDELTDTLELLPSFNALNEVIIYGKKREQVFGWTLDMNKIIPSGPSKSGASFDTDIMGALNNLFNYKRRKRLKETKKRMEEY